MRSSTSGVRLSSTPNSDGASAMETMCRAIAAALKEGNADG
jgi:hypothetical protein